jgi:phosphoribosylformylglycinamidine synthase subunit PurS
MYKVKVYVTLKKGVLDPQGVSVKHALHSIDFQEVESVKVGKYMELLIQDRDHVTKRIEEMCERLLANPVIEDYTYEVEEVVTP